MATGSTRSEERAVGPMPMCPMGETCKRMVGRRPSRFLIFVPGLAFIAAGLLIFVAPQILAWLVAPALLLAGLAMLGGAYFVHAIGRRLMRTHP